MTFPIKLSLVVIVALVLGACVGARYRGEMSPHFDGQRFFSPYGHQPKGLWDLVRWQWTREPEPWPEWVENQARPRLPEVVNDGTTVVTFVNHATLLVQTPEGNLLTDPIWSDRASPVSFAGPKRVRPPGLSWEQLPKIHYVLISHNHYDHFDEPTILKLARDHDPLFLVPLGDGRLLEGMSGVRFKEMDWWQTHDSDLGVRVHFLPAQHWSARGLRDRFLSLWGSFLIEGRGGRVYFGGDTGYATHFAEIAQKLGPVDLAILPIGAYEPRWFMKQHHMNPEEAVLAHRDLKARQSLGMHFGTFQLTDESFERPVRDLHTARLAQGLSEDEFTVLLEGETRVFQHPGDSIRR